MKKLLAAYQPRTRSGRVLASAAMADSVGSGLFLALIPVFVVAKLGIDPVKVGLVLGAANLFGLLSPLPAGRLSDRFGPGAGVVGVAREPSGRLRGIPVRGLVHRVRGPYVRAEPARPGSSPVQQAFIIQVEPPDERTRSVAIIRTVRNAGMSVGLLLSALAIAVDAYRIAFAFNAASYLVLLLAVWTLRGQAVPRSVPREGEDTRGNVLRDRRYLLMSIGNAVLMLHDSVLFTLIPLWMVTKTAAPVWLVGPLLALNTVLTVLLQVPLTTWATQVDAARRTLVRSLVPLVGACLLFLAAEPSEAVLAACLAVLAVVVLTFGENLHSVGAFELAHRLAPEHATGAYLGAFNLGVSAQLAFGPPFMTAVVLRGPVGWVALAVTFVVGGALMMAGSSGVEGKQWVSTSSS